MAKMFMLWIASIAHRANVLFCLSLWGLSTSKQLCIGPKMPLVVYLVFSWILMAHSQDLEPSIQRTIVGEDASFFSIKRELSQHFSGPFASTIASYVSTKPIEIHWN